jgi:hypothetical protein
MATQKQPAHGIDPRPNPPRWRRNKPFGNQPATNAKAKARYLKQQEKIKARKAAADGRPRFSDGRPGGLLG